jgi:ABC-type sugar transport system ATPase subunit
MLGRKLTRIFPDKRAPAADAPAVLSVRDLSYEPTVRDVSFEVRAGEILGIAGLDGSGREQLARVVFGELPAGAGTVELDGRAVGARSPRAAMRAGMGFVPAERGAQGLILDQSILANVVLPWLGDVSRSGLLGPRAGEAKVKRLVEEVAVRPPDVKARIGGLSGGNQQKSLFAKWIYDRPRVLLVNEPTRGVDIDGKHAIYELLTALADQGMALVVASSDMEEVLGLCHRVLVMSRGRVAAELVGGAITEEAVMAAAFNDTGAH